jgi:hypothetical protein
MQLPTPSAALGPLTSFSGLRAPFPISPKTGQSRLPYFPTRVLVFSGTRCGGQMSPCLRSSFSLTSWATVPQLGLQPVTLLRAVKAPSLQGPATEETKQIVGELVIPTICFKRKFSRLPSDQQPDQLQLILWLCNETSTSAIVKSCFSLAIVKWRLIRNINSS